MCPQRDKGKNWAQMCLGMGNEMLPTSTALVEIALEPKEMLSHDTFAQGTKLCQHNTPPQICAFPDFGAALQTFEGAPMFWGVAHMCPGTQQYLNCSGELFRNCKIVSNSKYLVRKQDRVTSWSGGWSGTIGLDNWPADWQTGSALGSIGAVLPA